jgi:hypothetical protein
VSEFEDIDIILVGEESVLTRELEKKNVVPAAHFN